MRFKTVRRPGAIAAVSALVAAVSAATWIEPVVAETAGLITGNDVRNGTLTTKDVRNRTLRRADFARGQLAPGRRSVGARHLKRGAATGNAVRDGSLTASDLAPGTLQGAGGNGAPGPGGPQGPHGPQGPPGSHGFVRVLEIAESFGPQALPGFSGNTIITPEACKTAPYASAGDVAIVSVSATGSPTAGVNDVMYAHPMQQEGLAGLPASLLPPNMDSAESLQDGTAYATAQAIVSLQEGTMYRWAVGVASNTALVINPGYCAGTVMIVNAGG